MRCLCYVIAIQMKNGNEFLLTDTVGFIQKLPTTLVSPVTRKQFFHDNFFSDSVIFKVEVITEFSP